MNKFVIVLIMVVLHIITVRFIHQKGNIAHPGVYDLAQEKLPDLSSKLIPDIISNLVIFLPFLFGWSVTKEFFNYFVIIFIIRSIFNMTTILPRDKSCESYKFDITHYFKGYCYDKIFSGHFVFVFLMSLIIYNRGIFTNVPILALGNLMYAALIVSTRSHYSVDILVASLVVTLVYQNKLGMTYFKNM